MSFSISHNSPIVAVAVCGGNVGRNCHNSLLAAFKHQLNSNTIMEIKQSNYGLIEIDNQEKDIVQIWMTETDPKNGSIESNLVQIERDNVKKLITALIACDKEPFTIMQYVRLYAYKPLKDIASDLGLSKDELKNIIDKCGTTISEMRGNLDAFKALRRKKHAKNSNN